MAHTCWIATLLDEVHALRAVSAKMDAKERFQRLRIVLLEARLESGLLRIAFDQKVKKLGINVISLRVHGNAEALRQAIETGDDSSANRRHRHIPREVRTACLIDFTQARM